MNQRPSSGPWSEIRHDPLHTRSFSSFQQNDMLLGLGYVFNTQSHDPWTPASTRCYWDMQRDLDEIQENSEATRASPSNWYGIFEESSEATSSLASDTARLQIQGLIGEDEHSYHKQGISSERLKETLVGSSRPQRWTEFSEFSIADEHTDLFMCHPLWNWMSASDDKSPYNHSRYIETVESFDPGGDDRTKDSQRSSTHASTVRIIDPPASYSVTSLLPSQTSENTQEPLQCLHCDTSFSGVYRKGNRARHIRIKHRSLPELSCSHCGQLFQRSDALRKHYRRKHPDLPHLTSSPRTTTSTSRHEHVFSSRYDLVPDFHKNDLVGLADQY